MSTVQRPHNAKTHAREERLAQLRELSAACTLDSWNSFVRELTVPGDLVPALLTNRPELLGLLKPRALSEEECGQLYTLIGGLLETNAALRQHAQTTAQLVEDWMSNFVGLQATAEKIQMFANFDRRVEN